MKLLIDLLHFIQPYGSYSYGVILAVLLACGFGLPLPEDVTLVAGGILASRDIIDFKFTVAVCMVGVLAGDGTIFFSAAAMESVSGGLSFLVWSYPRKETLQ